MPSAGQSALIYFRIDLRGLFGSGVAAVVLLLRTTLYSSSNSKYCILHSKSSNRVSIIVNHIKSPRCIRLVAMAAHNGISVHPRSLSVWPQPGPWSSSPVLSSSIVFVVSLVAPGCYYADNIYTGSLSTSFGYNYGVVSCTVNMPDTAA